MGYGKAGMGWGVVGRTGQDRYCGVWYAGKCCLNSKEHVQTCTFIIQHVQPKMEIVVKCLLN